ncbi:exopolysaccharide biosynthesis polyprenyl glycosylphosphotransferase [Dethiosulfatibacter aminovorans DSM 17477]|uniref:Exopolysaccharide biosynthesis polyprenyl glycosylphosphotransferase n=1 Tax=Dethiosulfatibacter aminovorans DSM 17477 TaxID=1121476 RepID=A0A1M6BP22_9FIRM|nr:exopolysaccharide biosynthesis polyprenyl glycosylphosphotransferase [Dethiosulfatibacter aminovorans]SHI50499.1 exopolysaccharide biosynthesis polyprenyl glycosylphosphotransferase [Dethiosulfatibacter aminovorans DSM 17477]
MIKKSNENKSFFRAQVIIDYLTIVGGLFIAFTVFTEGLTFADLGFKALLVLTTIISFSVFSVYKPYLCGKKRYLKTMYNSISSIICIHVIVLAIEYLFNMARIPSSIFSFSIIFSLAAFTIQKKIMFLLYQKVHVKEKSIVIGTTDDKEMITIRLIKHLGHLYDIRYILDSEILRKKMLMKYIDKSETVFISNKVDTVLKADIIRYCYTQNKEVFAIPTTLAVFNNTAEFTILNDIPVFSFSNNISEEEIVLKRAMDIVLSILGIVILSPVLIASIIAVKVQDGGPVFFKQTRLTINNKKFELIKFRTMVKKPEEVDRTATVDGIDPRLTGVGRILRMTGINNLPQFINVLKGEMSIIGPKPERPEIAEKFIKDYDEYRLRTKLKAGMTGLAQVSIRQNTAFKDKLIYDLYYINNYSLLLDIKIMFYNLRVIFTKPSAESLKKVGALNGTAKKINFDVKVYENGVIEVVK